MLLYILILIVGAPVSYVGPWWIVAPVCFVLCFFISRSAAAAFWSSALAGMTLWMGYSVYLHLSSDAGLTSKVVDIFTANLPVLSGWPDLALVLAMAALVAGSVSGCAGLAGARIRQLITSLFPG